MLRSLSYSVTVSIGRHLTMEISFDESSFLDVSNKVAIDDNNNVSTDLSEKEYLPCTPTHGTVSIFVCIIPSLSHRISCFFLCSHKTVISGRAKLIKDAAVFCSSLDFFIFIEQGFTVLNKSKLKKINATKPQPNRYLITLHIVWSLVRRRVTHQALNYVQLS